MRVRHRSAMLGAILAPALLAPPTFAQDSPRPPDLPAARAAFEATFRGQCGSAFGGVLDGMEPEVHALSHRADYEGAITQHYTLYGFACDAGAYNISSVWMLDTPYDGIVPLAFAAPVATYDYHDEEQTRLRAHRVVGMSADYRLVNAGFDPSTGTMSALIKWRGLGDAREGGTWHFEAGRFVLVSYEADPTFDGETEPVVTLFEQPPE